MADTRIAESVRADFPILSSPQELVYLDSAATTQKPNQVIDAVSNYYRNHNANVHRAMYGLAVQATALYEQSREKARQFINARAKSEVVLTSGTTESINLVAGSWGRAFLQKGDAVLLTEMEHHSNLIPWQLLASEIGIELRFVPFLENGMLDMEKLPLLWDDKVKLVSLTHVSNVFGTVNDVQSVCRFAHDRGALVLVDGAQAAPHMPVDVQKLDCDFYALSGHKMLGPMGIGVLYGKEKLLDAMPPYMGGGEMISSVWLDRAKWNDLPYKFEAGTPNVAGAVGLGAAIDYINGVGLEAIHKHEETLTGYALKALGGIDGLTIYGPLENRAAVISFNIDSIHSHDVAQFLDRFGIAVRAGHHCAHPLMRKLGVPSTVRASFYLYNTAAEIDKLKKAVIGAMEFFSHGI